MDWRRAILQFCSIEAALLHGNVWEIVFEILTWNCLERLSGTAITF